MAPRKAKGKSKGDSTRPDQPTDSAIASVPSETLLQILELVMAEEDDPFKRQAIRNRFGKVCCQWWTVACSTHEYAVRTSTRILRLMSFVEEKDEGESVRSLVLVMGEKGAAGGRSAGVVLLEKCPSVVQLELRLREQAKVGAPLVAALRGLAQVKEVALTGGARIEADDLDTSLQRLDLIADKKLVFTLARVPQGVTSLLSLVVRDDPHDSNLSSYTSTSTDSVGVALAPLVQGLHHFSAPDGWMGSSAFEKLLSSMTHLEYLKIGYLHNLPELRELVVGPDSRRWISNEGKLLHQDLLKIADAAPHRLSRVRVASSLTSSWTDDQKRELKQTAETAGITLVFF
ncbi:hypothetical protein BCR35DRAFT_329672 [Leucosporidium creatinivorum]|uniref:F-box domain-containing protein n=1 Tax=Leucosporidium creatinivorum TaxID=106004 RepID=A0A1Y2FXJ7_9BASI|nr:hypothetical protein BCR35DRAFT_329672 [Leucosporidium creatinivorum]